MRSRYLAGVAVLALAGAPALLSGQSDPRTAATGFLDAWNARRWTEAVQFLDLAQFDSFRKEFISRTRQDARQGPGITVEELRRRNPGMPLEVARYQVQMIEEQRRRYADPTPYEFARVSSVSALAALSPAEAAARWLESRDPQWQVRMQFQEAGCAVPSDLDQMPKVTRRLLGLVPDGDTATYGLFKEERPDDDAPSWVGGDVSVMRLANRGGKWVVEPRADLIPEVGQVDVSDCR